MKKVLIAALAALCVLTSFTDAWAGAAIVKSVNLVWLRSISGTDAFFNGQFPYWSPVIDGRHNSSNMTVATSLALQDTSQWIDVRDHVVKASPVGLTGPVVSTAAIDSMVFGTFTIRSSEQTAGTAGILDTLVIFRDASQDGLGSTPFDSLTSHVLTDSIRVPGVVAVDSITITACPSISTNASGKVIRYFSYSWPVVPSFFIKAAAGLSANAGQGYNFIRFRVKLTAGDLVAMSGNPSPVSVSAVFSYPAQEPNFSGSTVSK